MLKNALAAIGLLHLLRVGWFAAKVTASLIVLTLLLFTARAGFVAATNTALETENVRLKAENADLKSENARLRRYSKPAPRTIKVLKAWAKETKCEYDDYVKSSDRCNLAGLVDRVEAYLVQVPEWKFAPLVEESKKAWSPPAADFEPLKADGLAPGWYQRDCPSRSVVSERFEYRSDCFNRIPSGARAWSSCTSVRDRTCDQWTGREWRERYGREWRERE